MRSHLRLLPLAAWLVSACGGDDTSAPVDPCGSPQGVAEVRNDLVYQDLPGVSPRERNLDLYLPARGSGCGPAPIVVWVHGGDWGGGGKAELSDSLAAKLTAMGYRHDDVNFTLAEPSDSVIWPALQRFLREDCFPAT